MSDDPAWWSGRASKKRQNSRSSAQERRIAREVGGQVQPGSGSSQRRPQDVVSDDNMLSIKFTDAKSFSLKVDDLRKLRRDALRHGREPGMIVDYMQHGIRVRITIEEEGRGR